MATNAIPTPAPNTETFPQEVEVSISLKLKVYDQDGKNYVLDPTTQSASVSFLVDLYDIMIDADFGILSLNSLAWEQIKEKLLAEEDLNNI